MMTPVEKYNSEIYHYGVKGMKWGVRRYRNEDGSLTPAGQKRLYGTLRKYAKAKDHRQMLGVGVKEDKTIAEAASKAKDAAKKYSLAIAKRSELENLAEYGSTSKIRNDALKKYKVALKESYDAYDEYRNLTKKLANEYLGEYADVHLKTLANGKNITAGEAFCMQVEWGIGMGWADGDK